MGNSSSTGSQIDEIDKPNVEELEKQEREASKVVVVNWTDVEVPEDFEEPVDVAEQKRAREAANRFLDVGVRVTLAGFVGGLIGISHERRMESTGIFKRAATTTALAKRRAPPKALLARQPAKVNFPLAYSFACMAFLSVVETTRLAKPSSAVVDRWFDLSVKMQPPANMWLDFKETEAAQERREMMLSSACTVLDYTLGGSLAGLISALTRKPPPLSSSTGNLKLPSALAKVGRQPIILSGMLTGMGLGVLLGFTQVGIDVTNSYIEAISEEYIGNSEG